ncbi:MAG: GxxExxY protein [Herpetosiphon sp.]|nr:GxxExxY protein [Herpetosiphon sp.]
MQENAITGAIIDCAIHVHRTLGGAGLLEVVYEEALVYELQHRGLSCIRQHEVPILYRGQQLAQPLRLDLLVENLVIVEVKAVTNYNPIFEAQALTYLRLTKLRIALVINFGEKYLKDGIHRVINSQTS